MTNRMPTPPEARKVIVGVDTHKHVHVAVAIDSWGIRLRDQAFVADSGGYQALITWAETHGRIEAFGVEGTGSYGAGLARAVRRAGHRVVEVNRGDRRTRRAAGKSDTIDAEVAARSVLAGQSTAIPKTADGVVEMMRQLKITRDTAVKARTTAMNTLKQIVVHASPVLREALHDLTDHGLLTRCAGLRPGPLVTALVRGCGQADALQTVEPVTYRCGTRRVCQARSSGSERYTRARPHAVAPMNCVPEDSRRRSTCTGRTHAPRALADGHQTPSSTVAVRAPSPS